MGVKTETVTIRDRIFKRCPECNRLTKPVRCRYCGKKYKSASGLFWHEEHCPSNPLGICKTSKRPFRECNTDNEWQHEKDINIKGGLSWCNRYGEDVPWCEIWRKNNWLIQCDEPVVSYGVESCKADIKATMAPDAVKPPWMIEAGEAK